MRVDATDWAQSVEAKLVEKNTFLQLELQQNATDEMEDSPCRRSRSLTDTLIEYGAAKDADAPVWGSCRTSIGSSQLLEQPDVAEPPSSSSQSVGTDDEEEAAPPAGPCTLAPAPPTQTCTGGAPTGQQLYYYYPMLGAPVWGQGAGAVPPGVAPGQGCLFAPAAAAGPPAATAEMLQCAQLEARAAELRRAAAQLKAAARRVEADAAGTAAATPAGGRGPQRGAAPRARAAHQAEEPTTLMLRNIPNDYTRAMLLELLDGQGFAGKYDFVYLPIDFHRQFGFGYAFVNFLCYADADLARTRLQGFKRWVVSSQKVCQVCWGEPLQGLAAHIERYKSSPVMHDDVPDEFKPILFQGGVRVPFPAPTKRVRAPRTKRGVNDA